MSAESGEQKKTDRLWYYFRTLRINEEKLLNAVEKKEKQITYNQSKLDFLLATSKSRI